MALDEFAGLAARLVKPGGHVVCHMLAPGYHGHRLALLLTSAGRLKTGQPRPVQVRFGDQRIDQLPAHRRNTGMVFQNYADRPLQPRPA